MNTESIIITDEIKKDLSQLEDLAKRHLGRFDLGGMFSDTTDNFDKRKFGKIRCPFCKKQFNPYYVKTLIQKEWDFVWQGCSHKEPESECIVNCPKCKEELMFKQYIGQ